MRARSRLGDPASGRWDSTSLRRSTGYGRCPATFDVHRTAPPHPTAGQAAARFRGRPLDVRPRARRPGFTPPTPPSRTSRGRPPRRTHPRRRSRTTSSQPPCARPADRTRAPGGADHPFPDRGFPAPRRAPFGPAEQTGEGALPVSAHPPFRPERAESDLCHDRASDLQRARRPHSLRRHE